MALTLSHYQTLIANERAACEKDHLEGKSGLEVCQRWCGFLDDLIKKIYADAVTEQVSNFSLVALGGYGRGEVNPHSDIDLLFLFDKEIQPGAKMPQTKIIPPLWDIGFKVGHSTRSIGDCLRIAKEDNISKTSMIETRLLLGDHELFDRFKRQIRNKVIMANYGRFIMEKRMEADLRHKKFQNTLFLTEPNIKESPGGLRDYQTALWVSAARFGVRTLPEIHARGLLSDRDFKAATDAIDRLLRFRNDIHFLEKKPGDVLAYGLQPRVAKRLGYVGPDAIIVPDMMEDYYRSADTIYHLSRHITDQAVRYRSRAQLFIQRNFTHRQVAPNVHAGQEEVYIKDLSIQELAEQPETVFNAFRVMAERRLDFSNTTRKNLNEVGQLWKKSPPEMAKLAAGFRSVLETEDPSDAFRAMRDTKILTTVIPEFHGIRYLTPFDLYHRYTVDEHTFLAMREFDSLRFNERSECAILRSLYEDEPRKDLIRLAILFHDFGKGEREGEHLDDIDPAIPLRLGFSLEESNHIRKIVQQHLLLNMLAQRRDIHAPATLTAVLEKVGDLLTLKRLYMLTYADTTAVGPDVWNSWKGILLKDLFLGAQRLFEGAPVTAYPLEKLSAEERKFVSHMPGKYIGARIPSDIALDAKLYSTFIETIVPAVTHHRSWTDSEPGELIIVTRDKPGLLAILVGVLSSKNADIHHAEILTRDDGVVVDIFRITAHDGKPMTDRNMRDRVDNEIVKAITGETSVDELMQHRIARVQAPADLPVLEPSVKVMNDQAFFHTIVEVEARDRIGLLYDMSRTLAELKLNISSAKISTEGHRAVSSFYVREESGVKIMGEDRTHEVINALLQKLR